MRAAMLAVCATVAATNAATGAPQWIEVKSAHFTVISNSGDRSGRHAAWQFEQIRSGLSRLWPWAKIEGRPFVVFAVKDEATLKTLGPQYWEGKRFRPVSFWATGGDRRFVALRTDAREPDNVGANPYQTAYWSYADAVFSDAFPRRLPTWYRRGIAEVMSNTFVHEKELQVGRPLEENLRVLRERAPIPLAEFLAVERGSRWLTDAAGIRLFDAQAWALVHYLLFGDERRHAARVNSYNRLLLEGTDEQLAIREAFGDMKPYFEGMQTYVSRRLFGYARIPLALDSKPEGFAIRVLAPAEAALQRAEFLVAMRRPGEARALAAEAAKADPALPGPHEIEAALQDADGHRDEARAAYASAVQAGSRKAHAHYRLAQLEWRQDGDKELWERLAARLELARELDPSDANTLSFLAEMRSSLGQLEEALRLAIQAVETDPSGTYHRMALARILLRMQRPAEATRVAESAMKTTDDAAERQRVQEFLDFVARSPQ